MISRYLRRAARSLSRPRVLLYKNGDSIAIHPEPGVSVVLIDEAEPFVTRTCNRTVEPEAIDYMLSRAWRGDKVIEGSVA